MWRVEFFSEIERGEFFFFSVGVEFFFLIFRFFEIINFVVKNFLKIYTFHYLKILCTDSIKKI